MRTIFAKEKDKIIRSILENPNKEIRVRQLAKALGVSPSQVSVTVTLFKKEGIVENGKVKSNEAIVKALKILFNVNMLYTTSSISKIAEIKPAAAGLYGSWANGSNDEESDVDIWIRIKKRPREDSIALLSNELGKKLGRSVHILLLTDEKLAILKAKDQVFYHSLAFGSIILLGDQIE